MINKARRALSARNIITHTRRMNCSAQTCERNDRAEAAHYCTQHPIPDISGYAVTSTISMQRQTSPESGYFRKHGHDQEAREAEESRCNLTSQHLRIRIVSGIGCWQHVETSPRNAAAETI